MSNLSEINSIKSAIAELTQRVAAIETNALTVEIPAAKFELLPGEAVDLTWTEAVAWAKEQGGELPTRQEMLALFANLKSEFQPEWYWSSAQHADHSGYAWMQSFGLGSQTYCRKSDKCRARAVRRLPL